MSPLDLNEKDRSQNTLNIIVLVHFSIAFYRCAQVVGTWPAED
jgi:hypothetical protein